MPTPIDRDELSNGFGATSVPCLLGDYLRAWAPFMDLVRAAGAADRMNSYGAALV